MKFRRLLVLFAVLALLGAACGSDDDDTPADEGSASGSEAGGGEESFDDPLSVILLAETTGESPAAVPFLADGAQMAVDDLNEAGGVGGQEVEYERISAPLDPAGVEGALLEAVGEEPSGMLGLPSSGQVLAVAQRVADAQIPMLYMATAGQALVGEGEVANDYGFLLRPPQNQISEVLARVIIEELGITKVGLVCVNNPFGTDGCEQAEAVAEETGADIVAKESVEQTATDFTSAVLELRSAGAEGVVSYVFPNAVGALHNALATNGLDVPHVSGSSSLIAFTGAITSGNFDNLYGVDDCVPSERDADWASRFEERFGYAPTYLAAEAYDGVMLLAEAAKAAGSSDPAAIREALTDITYEGICDDYRGEPSQGLTHNVVAVSFAGEEISVVKEYEFEDYGS